jgi:hypothetical protein
MYLSKINLKKFIMMFFFTDLLIVCFVFLIFCFVFLIFCFVFLIFCFGLYDMYINSVEFYTAKTVLFYLSYAIWCLAIVMSFTLFYWVELFSINMNHLFFCKIINPPIYLVCIYQKLI